MWLTLMQRIRYGGSFISSNFFTNDSLCVLYSCEERERGRGRGRGRERERERESVRERTNLLSGSIELGEQVKERYLRNYVSLQLIL